MTTTQPKPPQPIELTPQEYKLIMRLRQLINRGRKMLLVELTLQGIRWHEVGRAEG